MAAKANKFIIAGLRCKSREHRYNKLTFLGGLTENQRADGAGQERVPADLSCQGILNLGDGIERLLTKKGTA